MFVYFDKKELSRPSFYVFSRGSKLNNMFYSMYYFNPLRGNIMTANTQYTNISYK